MATIYAFCHGAKSSREVRPLESLSPIGAEQIFGAADHLPPELAMVLESGLKRIVHSGTVRTRQSAEIIRAALLSNATLETDVRFDVQCMFGKFEPNSTLEKLKAARAEHDKALHIVRNTEYGAAARKHVTATLMSLAHTMSLADEHVAIVVSHAPFIELAVDGTGAEDVPGILREADAVVYEIENNRIIGSSYLRSPMMTLDEHIILYHYTSQYLKSRESE